MFYITLILLVAILSRKKRPEKLWDGPTPSLSERQHNWQWFVDYFQEYPNSPLKNVYPHLSKVAEATKRYKELSYLKESGEIDDLDYEIELQKILPLIDIAPDLKFCKNTV